MQTVLCLSCLVCADKILRNHERIYWAIRKWKLVCMAYLITWNKPVIKEKCTTLKTKRPSRDVIDISSESNLINYTPGLWSSFVWLNWKQLCQLSTWAKKHTCQVIKSERASQESVQGRRDESICPLPFFRGPKIISIEGTEPIF